MDKQDADNSRRKIGVVTYWQYNYGSILQCYATCKIITDLGYKPVVFSEQPSIIASVKRMLLKWNKYIFYPQYKDTIKLLHASSRKAINNLDTQTKEKMNAFIKQNVPVETKTILQWKKEAADNSYKAFLCGSDQVWSGYRYAGVENFFLRFAPRYKRIAWAPSFGTSDIATYNIRNYKKYIEEFSALSAREDDGVELIRKLTGLECKLLIDPVYLLTQEDWKYMASSNQYGRYALCYFLDTPDDDNIGRIQKFCDDNDLSIVIIGNNEEWIEKLNHSRKISCGPDEFVSFILHANYVFTDSFHGVSFSLILHTPFFVFHRNYTHGADQSSRILSILNMCNYESVYEPSTLKKMTWNFDFSDKVIREKRQEMIEYLVESINNTMAESDNV